MRDADAHLNRVRDARALLAEHLNPLSDAQQIEAEAADALLCGDSLATLRTLNEFRQRDAMYDSLAALWELVEHSGEIGDDQLSQVAVGEIRAVLAEELNRRLS